MGTLYVAVLWCTTIYVLIKSKRNIRIFHLKLPFLQPLKSLHNAWACLCNVICHFDEIIFISWKLKTVSVKRMHSLQEYCGADSVGV